MGTHKTIMLPPESVWLDDHGAAEYLSYDVRYFREQIICKAWFTAKPSLVTGSRRWRVSDLSDMLAQHEKQNKIGRPRQA